MIGDGQLKGSGFIGMQEFPYYSKLYLPQLFVSRLFIVCCSLSTRLAVEPIPLFTSPILTTIDTPLTTILPSSIALINFDTSFPINTRAISFIYVIYFQLFVCCFGFTIELLNGSLFCWIYHYLSKFQRETSHLITAKDSFVNVTISFCDSFLISTVLMLFYFF